MDEVQRTAGDTGVTHVQHFPAPVGDLLAESVEQRLGHGGVDDVVTVDQPRLLDRLGVVEPGLKVVEVVLVVGTVLTRA